MEQPEPLKFVPVRKTEKELKAERVAEVKKEFEFLTSDPGAIEWGKQFPEKLEADLERLKKEVPDLKVAKKEKVEKEEKKEKKEEEPKKEKIKKPKK